MMQSPYRKGKPALAGRSSQMKQFVTVLVVLFLSAICMLFGRINLSTHNSSLRKNVEIVDQTDSFYTDDGVRIKRRENPPVSSNKTDVPLKGAVAANTDSGSTKTNETKDEREMPYSLIKRGKQPKGSIKRIALLGERNSGTRWMFQELGMCFNHTLKVTRNLVRYKHWFQNDDGRSHGSTLVIAQFRDPYYWTEAMRAVPHHAPMHLYLDWQDFVTRPWTMPRPERDLALTNTSGPICQQNFHYNDIISCVPGTRPDDWEQEPGVVSYSGHQPQYELKNDGSGNAYASIVDMRRDKILNFLGVSEWDYVLATLPVRYEELVGNGTAALLKQIEEMTGVKAACKPTPAQNRTQRVLNSDFVQWMNKNADWETERLIGYHKADTSPSSAAMK